MTFSKVVLKEMNIAEDIEDIVIDDGEQVFEDMPNIRIVCR